MFLLVLLGKQHDIILTDIIMYQNKMNSWLTNEPSSAKEICYLYLHEHHHQLWRKNLHPIKQQLQQSTSSSWQKVRGSPQRDPAHTITGLDERSISLKANVVVLRRTGNNKVTRQLKRRSITSLNKSPCFLSSASIALSSIPPTVALVMEKQQTISFSMF